MVLLIETQAERTPMATMVDATPASEGTVVVTDAGGRVAQQVRAGRHVLIADEPGPVGDGAGPTPYDLLLGALGACTAMTVRLYAARKAWPLDSASVRLSHGRRHAADAGDPETKGRMIDHIDVLIDLRGPLTREQRGRLLEIAERCPVHRTLMGEKQIDTRLAPPTAAQPRSASRSASAA
jgi:putative redox protein